MNNFITAQAEKSLEAMLNDCSIDAIIAIDNNDNIISWNKPAEKIHGKAKHEVIGSRLQDIIPSIYKDEESLEAIEYAKKGIKSFLNSTGNYYHRVYAENHFIPLKNGNKIIGVMNLVHEVAHRIKAEEQLQYLNNELTRKNKELQLRNAELISLSNVASHDLKEPLRKIYTAVEVIITNEAQQLSNNGKAHLRRIQSATQKMGLITDGLLAFTSITKEKNEENYSLVDLNNVLREAQKSMYRFIEDKNAAIKTTELKTVYGNYTMLVQLFQNIINNGIKFQHKNSRPLIKISATVTEKKNGNYLNISFLDNGIGFKNEEADNIFNLFTQLNSKEEYSGNGMGLAICKKIMEQHNGFINATSKEEDGTEICCYFPVK